MVSFGDADASRRGVREGAPGPAWQAWEEET